MSTINKAALTNAVKNASGITANEAKRAVDAFIDEIVAELVKGGEVEIRGLFSARVVSSMPTQRRNPMTGEKVSVPAKNRVKIKVAKSLKDRVNAF